jgi:hypothetical protein
MEDRLQKGADKWRTELFKPQLELWEGEHIELVGSTVALYFGSPRRAGVETRVSGKHIHVHKLENKVHSRGEHRGMTTPVCLFHLRCDQKLL